MLVRESRTSSANGAFGRQDRHDSAGMPRSAHGNDANLSRCRHRTALASFLWAEGGSVGNKNRSVVRMVNCRAGVSSRRYSGASKIRSPRLIACNMHSAEFRMRVLVKRRMINWDYGPKKKGTGTMAGPPIARTSLS